MRPRVSVHSSYTYLLAMLDQGWRIEPPVYVRASWRSRSPSRQEDTFHFVLWRGGRVNLVSVPDGPEVQRFLADNKLVVDRL